MIEHKTEHNKINKDILIFMSDQHTPYYSGFYGNQCVDTPYLNRLAQSGVCFDECYTASPLCGPSRMSFLSGIRPAKTGIFHKSILPDTTPTFLHCMVEAGYETVLIGRMHFLGADQYHGFTKHIAADMTPVTWDYMYAREAMRKERGVYVQTDTFSGRGAGSIAGGGTSPVLEYDRFVVEEALKYLAGPHEKPQCICVSIYGPHFPYVAPKELFLKYQERVKLPVTYDEDVCCDVLKHYQKPLDEEMALACQAAYCGMVEHMDTLFGQVWDAFEVFCKNRNTKHAVFYLSDHGDQVGDRHIVGKETFYERSAKIPFIASGDDILSDKRVSVPVSMMDIGPSILEYAGAAPLRDIDGVSVASAFNSEHIDIHPVVSEFMEKTDGGFIFAPYKDSDEYSHGFMLRYGDYKYVTYQTFEDQDALYNIKEDPEEQNNLAQKEPEKLNEMRRMSQQLKLEEEAQKNFRREARVNDLMLLWEREKGDADESLRWKGASEAAGQYPEICYKNSAFFENGHVKEKKFTK